jgi:hypothetical protein
MPKKPAQQYQDGEYVDERSVKAMLRKLGARPIPSHRTEFEDWETNTKHPFQLQRPQLTFKPDGKPMSGLYDRGYVESLRSMVENLSQRSALSGSPNGSNHFNLNKKDER